MVPGQTPEVQLQRFHREARASINLRSQHVVHVQDVGTMEDGAPYMVMELLDGRDLVAELQARGPFAVALAVDYVLQACHAVAEAHRAGIVHRDIKPANLFLTHTPDGGPCVKVLDFGISKIVSEEIELTGDMEALGSPLYMSPEQMRAAREVDGRADVWALGVTLYQLIGGRTPFHGENVREVARARVHGSADAAREPAERSARGLRGGGDAVPGEGSGAALPQRGCARRRAGAVRIRGRTKVRGAGGRDARRAPGAGAADGPAAAGAGDGGGAEDGGACRGRDRIGGGAGDARHRRRPGGARGSWRARRWRSSSGDRCGGAAARGRRPLRCTGSGRRRRWWW